jgi:hemolysin activation/secretion protein
MVMFKAKFKPLVADRPHARLQAQQQQQCRPGGRPTQQQQQPQPAKPQVPPIEEERGPQAPVREPAPLHEPERALAQRVSRA